MLFAPALPLIIYGIVAKVDIDAMFVAGIWPGTLLIAAVSATALWLGRANLGKGGSLWLRDATQALRGALWDLLIPVCVLGLLLGGFATVVEAAALGCLYVMATALWVHRDVPWKKLVGVVRDAAVLIGSVLVILGVALAFTGYLVDAEIPQAVVEITQANIESKVMFLLVTNILLLVVGCLLDIFSALVCVCPTFSACCRSL